MSKRSKLMKLTMMAIPFFGISSFALSTYRHANNSSSFTMTRTKFTNQSTVTIKNALDSPLTAEEFYNKRNNLTPDVKKFIAEQCLTGLPPDFNPSGILKINIADWNSITGEVTLTAVEISSYVDMQGNIISTPIWINGSLVINNFKTVQPTQVVHSFNVPSEYNETSPSAVNEDEVKKIIDANIASIVKNYPGTLDSSSYTFTIEDRSETSGCIYINLKLRQIVSPVNGTISTENTDRILILYGFKQSYSGTAVIQPTNNYPNASSMLAQDIYDGLNKSDQTIINNLKQFINEHVLHDTPNGFTTANIVSMRAKKFNNLTGELVIDNIVVNTWKDTSGQVQQGNNYSLPGSFVLIGFKIVAPTKIIDSINVGYDFQNRPLKKVTDDEIVDWMRANVASFIKNYPGETIDGNKVSFKVETRNDAEGSVNVKVTVPETYNQNGVKGNGGPNLLSKTVKLTGFEENILKTYIVNPSISVSGSLATYTPGEINNNFTDINKLKEFIYNNMIMNKPIDSTYAIIESIEFDRKPDSSQYEPTTLVIKSITLNTWVDNDGAVKKGSNAIKGPFKINGFKKATATTVSSTLDVSQIFPDLNAFQVPQEKFLSWLSENENWKQIIQNAPSGFNVRDNIVIHSYQPDRTTNIIRVTIGLTKYYSSTGELINHGDDQHEIQLINFAKTQNATYIVSPSNSQNITGFKNITPDIAFNEEFAGGEYNNNLDKLKQFISDNLIKNKPQIDGRPFNYKDITEVVISKTNNRNGYIEVSSVTLANSLDSSGQPLNRTHKIDYAFKVHGFKSIGEPTSIASSINIDSSSSLYNSELSSISETTIRDYILDESKKKGDNGSLIVTSLPSIIDEFNFNEYIVLSMSKDFNRREIKISIALNLYYSDDVDKGYPLVKKSSTDAPIRQTCIITGFPNTSPSWIDSHFTLFIVLIVIGSLLLLTLIIVPIVLITKRNKENKILCNQLVGITDDRLLGNPDLDQTLGIGGLNINRTIGNNLGVQVDSLSDVLNAQVAQNAKLSKESKKQIKARKKFLKEREKVQKKYYKELEKQRKRNDAHYGKIEKEKEKYKQQYLREGEQYFETMQEQRRVDNIRQQAAYEAQEELRRRYGMDRQPQNRPPQGPNNGPYPPQKPPGRY